MGSTIYRPGHAKASEITVRASHDEQTGWSLTVVRSAETQHGVVTQRMKYSGLSDSELVDVVDVELHQALGLI